MSASALSWANKTVRCSSPVATGNKCVLKIGHVRKRQWEGLAPWSPTEGNKGTSLCRNCEPKHFSWLASVTGAMHVQPEATGPLKPEEAT